MACIPIKGLYSSFQLRQAGDGVSILFNSYDSAATPLQDNHDYAALFQTVKPGAAMRDLLSGASGKQLRHTLLDILLFSSRHTTLLLQTYYSTPLDILLQTFSSRHTTLLLQTYFSTPLDILLFFSRNTPLLFQTYYSTPLEILLYSSRDTPLLQQNILLYSIQAYFPSPQCDLKVSSSQAKIAENFANFFLKTKASKTCITVLNVHENGYIKAYVSQSGKTKAQGVATLQIRPCIKN